jgi:hypothetical protein
MTATTNPQSRTGANAAPEPEATNVVDLFKGTAGEGYKDPVIAAIMALLQPSQEAIVELRSELAEANALIAKLTLHLSELKAEQAETRAKSNETSFIVARLRLDHKGDPGCEGKMGRDGPPGPRGVEGKVGRPGMPLVGWQIDPDEFLVYGLLGDGIRTPPLNLLPFFQAYNGQTGVEDEVNEVVASTEAMALQRARLEYDAERMKRGLPVR